ncbi:hypothetical protein M404DRAFT_1005764 [Pisolithus tinctorius Marx 270]|uniref:Uncharacterized protein n=1 Tax=Pisolithus tinctorius Marx 270 TaxID=870435 RepID=A0A0C3N9Y9_PISTI|nr:hypothetical protein M404DRAFT_1005764 [Pisolithus tinctorius Marx 270]
MSRICMRPWSPLYQRRSRAGSARMVKQGGWLMSAKINNRRCGYPYRRITPVHGEQLLIAFRKEKSLCKGCIIRGAPTY